MVRTLVDDCFRPNQPRLKHGEAVAQLQHALKSSMPSGSQSPSNHGQPAATSSPAEPSTSIDVKLCGASGRTLARDIVASEPVPAHTNSAVDGYAFRSSDVIRENGTLLLLAGRAAAGHPLLQAANPASTVRIFTGAVMPQGLDTVVMQEDVALEDHHDVRSVRIPKGLKAGANVRKAGEDVAKGTVLFESGSVLRPQDLAALASIGCSHVPCFPRVRVAIASTGDEVISPGSAPLAPGQVYDANAPMLSALATLAGAEVERLGIWPDTLASVSSNLRDAARNFDVILTSGGASLGEEDHMARALASIGQRHLWQLAVKPGRPMMFGQIRSGQRDTIVVGLPGNPVAVFVCFLMYVFPLLRAAGGAPWPEPARFMLPADFAFAGRKTGRREFWRGRLRLSEAGMVVEKFNRDGSGLISGLRWSGGLIDIPEDCGDVAKGDRVAFIPYTEFGIV